MKFTFTEPKLINFIKEHSELDLELILLELLPLIEYCLGKKEEGMEQIKNSLTNLICEIKSENELNMERYSSTMNDQYRNMENVLLRNNNEIIQLLSRSEESAVEKLKNEVQNLLVQSYKDITNVLTNSKDKSAIEESIKLGNKEIQHLLAQNQKDVIHMISNTNSTSGVEETIKLGNQHMEHLLAQTQKDIVNKISNMNDKTMIEQILKINNQEILNLNSNSIQNLLAPIQNSLQEIHSSFTNSSKKGIYSENKIEFVLHNSFPNYQIDTSKNIPQSGDYIIQHPDCGKILIENKDYGNNVPKPEIDKFIRDTEVQNSHGILMSQRSGIAGKDHFHIEFNKGRKILIYLYNLNFDSKVIKECISVINSLHFMTEHIQSVDSNISETDMNDIFQEWTNMKKTNDEIISALKVQISKIKEMSLPKLESIISTRFPHNICTFECEFCLQKFKNKAALASHKIHCKVKQCS